MVKTIIAYFGALAALDPAETKSLLFKLQEMYGCFHPHLV